MSRPTLSHGHSASAAVLALLAVVAVSLGGAAGQVTLHQEKNVRSQDGGWVLPMAQSSDVNCDDPAFARFDNSLSSFTVRSGQLRIYRLGYFTGLVLEIFLPPGLGAHMVNLSPNLENVASSWTWMQVPGGFPGSSRRSLKDYYEYPDDDYYWHYYSDDSQADEDEDSYDAPNDDSSDDDSYEHDTSSYYSPTDSDDDSDSSYLTPTDDSDSPDSSSPSDDGADDSEADSGDSSGEEESSEVVEESEDESSEGSSAAESPAADDSSSAGPGPAPAVGCSQPAGSLPLGSSSAVPAASVTFFDKLGSTYGDWPDRGESNNFCEPTSGGGLPLASRVSAAFICGAGVSGYDLQGQLLFRVRAEAGYCVDINLDAATENRMVTFDFEDSSSSAPRVAPHEVYGPPGAAVGAMSGTSTLFVAPEFDTCHTPYPGPADFPEGPDGDEEDITAELGDDGFVEVSLGVGFDFFGVRYDKAFVGSNGFLSFGQGLTGYDSAYLDGTGVPRIAAAQADLDPTAGLDEAVDVTAESSCVAKTAQTAVKPLASDADWSEKHDSLTECFEQCRPADGFTMIDHNRETGSCYCWKGFEGDEWQPEAFYLGDAYDVTGCASRVTYRRHDDRFVLTFANVPFYGSTETVSFQLLLMADGSVRMTHGPMAATGGEQSVYVGLFSGSLEDSVARELSSSPPCGACNMGLSCAGFEDSTSSGDGEGSRRRHLMGRRLWDM